MNELSTSNHMFGWAIWAWLHFWKFWNCLNKKRIVSKFLKIARMIYPKNLPNKTFYYWLIISNQQTLLKLNSFNSASGQLQNNTVYLICKSSRCFLWVVFFKASLFYLQNMLSEQIKQNLGNLTKSLSSNWNTLRILPIAK